jgi:hypothetical protein
MHRYRLQMNWSADILPPAVTYWNASTNSAGRLCNGHASRREYAEQQQRLHTRIPVLPLSHPCSMYFSVGSIRTLHKGWTSHRQYKKPFMNLCAKHHKHATPHNSGISIMRIVSFSLHAWLLFLTHPVSAVSRLCSGRNLLSYANTLPLLTIIRFVTNTLKASLDQ